MVRGGAPIRWSAIASDAVHNLRSSLDILWRQVMAPNEGDRIRKKSSYFPICKSAHKFEARFGRVVKGRRKAAIDLLRAAKPYKGGNDALWALDAIDCRNKHEILTLIAATYKTLNIMLPPDVAINGHTGVSIRCEPATGFPALEDGAILIAEVHMEYQLTPDVAFGKGEILEGEPVVETLHEFAQLVDGIADAFLSAGLLT